MAMKYMYSFTVPGNCMYRCKQVLHMEACIYCTAGHSHVLYLYVQIHEHAHLGNALVQGNLNCEVVCYTCNADMHNCTRAGLNDN